MSAVSSVFLRVSAHTQFWLLSISIISTFFALLIRAIYRGPYYSAWDVLGPAHGQYLTSTQPFWSAFAGVFRSIRHIVYWNHTNSLLYTLIPGYLGSVLPWEYWGQLLTLILVLISLGLIVRIAGLPVKESWVVLLAWGSSSALLSFSIAGYPYATGFLPFAMAFWVVLEPRIRASWILTLLLGLLADELSWHLYEQGKSVFIVFLAAAVLERGVPLPTRIVWAVCGTVQLVMSLVYKSVGVGFLIQLDHLGLREIFAGLWNLGHEIFISRILDVPVLFVLGVASFFFFREHRRLFLAVFLSQILLTYLLTMKGLLIPRRFLVVEFFCILSVAAMYRESHLVSRFGKLPRAVLVGMLLIGNVWQFSGLMDYIKTPVYKMAYPLPYTFSPADYVVPASDVDIAQEIIRRVEMGEKILLIYNFSAYPFGPPDPPSLMERIYLSLGHKRFMDSVYVFGSQKCREDCLPIRSMIELTPFLDNIREKGPIPPELVMVYYPQNLSSAYLFSNNRHVFSVESAEIFSEIRKRFDIHLESPKDSTFMRFKIAEKDPARPDLKVKFRAGQYERKIGKTTETRPFTQLGVPIDVIWVENPPPDTPYVLQKPWEEKPFTLRLMGTVYARQAGAYNFIFGSNGNAVMTLNGQVVPLNNGVLSFQLSQRSMVLERGNYPIEIVYSDIGEAPHFLMDISPVTEDSLQKQVAFPFEAVRLGDLFPDGLKGRYYSKADWTGDSKPAGSEILIGDALEGRWGGSSGSNQKPWEPFSLRLEGEMDIKVPGIYKFDLTSDDGSLLYLDGTLVLDNGGVKPRLEDMNKKASLLLKPGRYAFRLDYFDVAGQAVLKLDVKRQRVSQ